MEKQTLLEIIAEMRKTGCIKTPLISAYFNMLLGAGEIRKAYDLISEDNIEIILRTVMKQYVKMHKCQIQLLKLEEFYKIVNEKKLGNHMLIKLFKVCMQKSKHEEHVKACKTFIRTCDLLFDYKEEG